LQPYHKGYSLFSRQRKEKRKEKLNINLIKKKNTKRTEQQKALGLNSEGNEKG